MKNKVIEMAHMYAIHAISIEQLLDVCDDIQEAKEAISHAKYYADKLKSIYMGENNEEKERQIEESWELIDSYYKPFYSDEDVRAFFEAHEDRMYPSWCWDEFITAYDYTCPYIYSDEELQRAFDEWNENKKGAIIRIAKEAKQKNIPWKIISKFLREYKLSHAEMTVFWLAYNNLELP